MRLCPSARWVLGMATLLPLFGDFPLGLFFLTCIFFGFQQSLLSIDVHVPLLANAWVPGSTT
jgi:hypothetical protein